MTPPAADDWIARLRFLAGGEQRLRVLAVLAAHDEAIYHETIRKDFADRGWTIHPTGLSKILRELEREGYIDTDVPAGQRPGRAVRYSTRPDNIRAALQAAIDQLT